MKIKFIDLFPAVVVMNYKQYKKHDCRSGPFGVSSKHMFLLGF